MGKAVFVGGSALFFTSYLLVAEAFGIIGGTAITSVDQPAPPEQGSGFFGAVDAILNIFNFGFNLIANFFQLMTFQAPGLEGASLITALIFVPLTLINGWIIVTAIRG